MKEHDTCFFQYHGQIRKGIFYQADAETTHIDTPDGYLCLDVPNEQVFENIPPGIYRIPMTWE